MQSKLPKIVDKQRMEKKPHEQYEDIKRKINEFHGIDNYKARAAQIEEVMEHITAENYKDMRRRVKGLDSDDSVTGSSNFGKFIMRFESDDSGWIEEINDSLE